MRHTKSQEQVHFVSVPPNTNAARLGGEGLVIRACHRIARQTKQHLPRAFLGVCLYAEHKKRASRRGLQIGAATRCLTRLDALLFMARRWFNRWPTRLSQQGRQLRHGKERFHRRGMAHCQTPVLARQMPSLLRQTKTSQTETACEAL